MASQPQPVRDDPELLRPPLQTRSRESLERVLEAGRELLEEEGLEGFTVQEVSRRAKVSIGSIYARAPSKESLLLAVYDRAVGEIGAANAEAFENDERWDGLDARELIERAVDDARPPDARVPAHPERVHEPRTGRPCDPRARR